MEREIESTYNYFSVVKNLGDLSRMERKRRGEGGRKDIFGENKKVCSSLSSLSMCMKAKGTNR